MSLRIFPNQRKASHDANDYTASPTVTLESGISRLRAPSLLIRQRKPFTTPSFSIQNKKPYGAGPARRINLNLKATLRRQWPYGVGLMLFLVVLVSWRAAAK